MGIQLLSGRSIQGHAINFGSLQLGSVLFAVRPATLLQVRSIPYIREIVVGLTFGDGLSGRHQ
ncbi:MAG: hypothetical protein ABW168_22935 [Sedimenticola sp.]